MIYNIRGDKILVTDAIKDYITEKLGRLDKYFKNDELNVNVLIKVKGFNQTIEVTIPTPNFTIRNEESAEDLYAAIDLVTDKIERQIRKNKTKINSKIKRNIIQNFEMDLEDNFDEDSKVLKRKKVDMKPMDEEEAILQMEMLGHSFFVFKNADTDSICVLYLRKDGNYGIIETN